MAISFANLGASAWPTADNSATNPDINDGTNTTSYANSSWTPPTSGLIIAFVDSRRNNAADVPTLSGNNLTWVQIGSILALATNDHTISLFAANASGSTTGAMTVSFGTNTQVHCMVSLFHVTGVDLSGGVSGAFGTPATGTGTGTSGTVTLASPVNSDSRPISCFIHVTQEDTAVRANWTLIDSMGGAGAARGWNTQYRGDAFETTASASWTTSIEWGGMAVELKAAATESSFPPLPGQIQQFRRRTQLRR